MYSNFGDKDFFENGFLINFNGIDYDVIYCQQHDYEYYEDDDEQLFDFGYLRVDIDDSWIDLNEVAKVCGRDMFFYDDEKYLCVCDVVAYYGPEEFGTLKTETRKDIAKIMQGFYEWGDIGNDVRF